MAWGRESSRRIAGASIVAALPWSLIWQGLGGWPWPRCSVAPGNLSNIGKSNSFTCVPHCMEFDSGGNGVRETSRTGLPWHNMANGDWHSFLVRSPSWHVDVSRQLKTKTKVWTSDYIRLPFYVVRYHNTIIKDMSGLLEYVMLSSISFTIHLVGYYFQLF